jgi:protein SCO1/2
MAFAGSYLPVIEPAPRFALVDSEGHPATSAELDGQVVILAFMYTHCTTVCPMVTERMAAIAKRVGRAAPFGAVRLVSISFDPARDTPAWLKTYSESIGADPRRWMFLSGSPEQLASVMKDYDFHVERKPTGDFDHVSRVYLIDTAARVRNIYSASFLDPPAVERDVNSLLAERRQSHAPGAMNIRGDASLIEEPQPR